MSTSPSFGEQAAELLAQIADLVLDGEDWATLERLQAALHPTFGGPSPVAPIVDEVAKFAPLTIEDSIRSIYSDEIRKQLDASMSLPLFSPTPPESPVDGTMWVDTSSDMHARTYNGSQWTFTTKGPKPKRKH
jgi:hypothetical protein